MHSVRMTHTLRRAKLDVCASIPTKSKSKSCGGLRRRVELAKSKSKQIGSKQTKVIEIYVKVSTWIKLVPSFYHAR